jgi:hypothetical protein
VNEEATARWGLLRTKKIYHRDNNYVIKDVRIRCYFLKPTGVREQEYLESTVLEYLTLSVIEHTTFPNSSLLSPLGTL